MNDPGRAAPGLTRRVGIVACGRAANAVSLLAIIPILSWAWPKEEFGLFSAIWFLGNTLVPIFLVGLPTSLLYFFPRAGSTGQRSLVSRAALVLAVSGGLLVLLLNILAPHVTPMLEALGYLVNDVARTRREWAPVLYPFAPYFFSLVAGGFAESTLVAAGRPSQQAVLAMVGAAGLIAVAAGGALLGASMSQVATGLSVMGLARMALAYIMTARAVSMATGGDPDQGACFGASIRDLVSYSIPIAMNDTIGALSRAVDRVVVVVFFGVGHFASYHVGALEVPVSLLLAAVVTVLIPEISRLSSAGQLDQIGNLWRQAVGHLSLLTIPLFFVLFAHAGPIVALFLPPEYAQAEWVFRVFLLALPLRSAIYNPLLVGMGKASWALWGGVGDLICNISLSIALAQLLTNQWGTEWAILGPAIATVVSTYAQVIVLVLLIARHLRWCLWELMPWWQLLRTTVLSACAAVVSLMLSHMLEQAVAKLLIGVVSYSVVILALSWLHVGQREQIRSLMVSFRRPRELEP